MKRAKHKISTFYTDLSNDEPDIVTLRINGSKTSEELTIDDLLEDFVEPLKENDEKQD